MKFDLADLDAFAEPLWQVIDRLSQSEFTRVPVFKGERSQVIGIVNTKRLALRWLQGAVPGALADLVQLFQAGDAERGAHRRSL